MRTTVLRPPGQPGRRTALLATGGLLFATTAWPRTGGAGYPDRPIRIVVPSAPGGVADVNVRTVAPRLKELLGQPIVIDYKVGASGTIGLNGVVHAPADGYTLVFISETHAAAESLYPQRGYVLQRDLAPVAPLASGPMVLAVNKDLPVQSVAELIALAKEQPGRLTFGSGGVGNVYHLAAELLQKMAGIHMQHVPYSQAGTARTDLIAGEIKLMFDAPGTLAPLMASGAVRGLAVTSLQRLPTLPDLPTVAETVPGYEFDVWGGIAAPAGTPPAIITQLNSAITTAVQDKSLAAQFARTGVVPRTATPQQFGEWIRTSVDKWGQVIREAGIKLE